MKRRIAIVAIALLCFVVVGYNRFTVQADGRPLPPLPAASIIEKVVNQTSGLPFIPLGTPPNISKALGNFSGVFEGVTLKLDYRQTIHYFATNGDLLESVVPLWNSGATVLDADITAPGTNPRPGKIIGAVFQPARGHSSVMVIVAIFKADKPKDPPEKLRFYYTSTRYHEYSFSWGKFSKGKDKMDDGALVAHKYSCVTVGTEQACWEPHSYDSLRQQPVPKDIVYSAYTDFKNVYNMGIDFYVDDAVPDLAGEANRNACAAAMTRLTRFTNVAACQPNLVFTAAKERVPNKPLGIFVVTQTADIKTYRASDGAMIGALPVGKYIVMDATPAKNKKGEIAALFLINLDTVNHYLIPSRVIAGFSESSAIQEPQAAIKDGYLWSRGFGYP